MFSTFTNTYHGVDFVVLCLVLFAIVYYYSTSTFGKWEKLKIPYVRPVPLFGNYLRVALGIDHPVDTYKRIYRELAGHKYGGYFQMRTPYLMIRDPEIVNRILIKDFAYFPNRGIYTDFDADPLTNNLFFMRNPQWKTIRSKLSPAFTSGKLKLMYDQIKACGVEMMGNIHEKVARDTDGMDVRDILASFATDVIGTCVFGLKLNAINDSDSEFRRHGKHLFGASRRTLIRELCLMISPMFLKIVRLRNFPSNSIAFFRSVFRETFKYREENNVFRNDYVDTLMQARKDLVLNDRLPKEEQFTEQQIVSNAFVMFAAGFETISTTLSFCLYELSFKKHIQEKIDKDALDKQVQEKKMIRDQEQAKDQAYSQKLLQDCTTSLQLEEQNKKKQKKIDLEILRFRKQFQTPETRREYDVNDRPQCKNEQLSRIDDDLTTTLSSGQRFDGEKGVTKEQRAEQMLQQRVWLELQIREKKMAREEDKNVERTWQETERTTIQRALALASLENDCRKKLVEANCRYNQALATEQRMNNSIAEAQGKDDEMVEVYNAITGDFLTENPQLGFNSALGPGRIVTVLYKGLTPAMKQAIYDEQAKQRQEIKTRKETFEKQERDWAELLNMLATCGTINDIEMQRKKRNLEDEIKNVNLSLAEQQKKQQEFLNNVLYKTITSDEFFEQFNKTTR